MSAEDVETTVAGRQDVELLSFQPFDWRAEEKCQVFPPDRLTVRCWAKTRSGETVLIWFPNYKYEFYMEVPMADANGKKLAWTKDDRNQVLRNIEGACLSNAPCVMQMVYKALMNSAALKEKRMMYIAYFHTKRAMLKTAKILKEGIQTHMGLLRFVLHEMKIPVLSKLFAYRSIAPMEWLTVECCRVSGETNRVRKSQCLEYVGDVTTLTQMKDPPSLVMPCKVCSFDLECYSSRGDTVFPSAKIPEDEIFMVSAVFQMSGDKSTRRSFLFTLFDVGDSADDAAAYQSVVCKDEMDLLNSFCKKVKEEDPDVLIGHNIWQFDMKYMYLRAMGSQDSLVRRLPP